MSIHTDQGIGRSSNFRNAFLPRSFSENRERVPAPFLFQSRNARSFLRSFRVPFRNFQCNKILNINRIIEQFTSKVIDHISIEHFLWIIRIFGSNLEFFVFCNFECKKRNAKGTRVLIFVVAFLSRSFSKIRNAFLPRSSLSGTRSSNALYSGILFF